MGRNVNMHANKVNDRGKNVNMHVDRVMTGNKTFTSGCACNITLGYITCKEPLRLSNNYARD